MVAGIAFGEIPTMVVLALLSGCTAFEFYRMVRAGGHAPLSIFGTACAALFPVVGYLGGLEYLALLALTLVGGMLVCFVIAPSATVADCALSVFGALYTGFALSALLLVRMGAGGGWPGAFLALGVFASVLADDIFAYLVGSKLGRHKMAPRISPKKSWEGFVAGVVGSVAVWCVLPFLVPALSFGWALAGGVACALSGVLGDFAESRIKRDVGVKDSGSLMPGHGGLLDRNDSLILASVASYLVLLLSGVL